MLDVLFTVDVEVWCGGWKDLDKNFPNSFQRYVYGPTSRGHYGIPYHIEVLNQYGLKGVFFVETLFALRFGQQALDEIVGLIIEGGHEVQLHLHTEWVDEARNPLFDHIHSKRQHLRYFSLEEQVVLIAQGVEQLKVAGVQNINAFRAGSFAFNSDTLLALAANGIVFDSSYNASMFGLDSGLMTGIPLVEPVEFAGVYEYPMTVFNDGTTSLRHTQLMACTFDELEGLLWQAVTEQRRSFVILSHSFEMLNKAKDRPDDVVVRRFEKLCAFLDRNRDAFRVTGFQGLHPTSVSLQPLPLVSPLHRTGIRMLSQIYRRKYR